MLTAAANAYGGFGVQLWIRLGSAVQIATWQAVSPRLLFAVLLKNGVTIVTAVAHAPIEAHGDDEKTEWWENLSSLTNTLLQQYKDAEFCLLIDANARVGSVLNDSIGKCSPQKENNNGTRLRTYLGTNLLTAVNTFYTNASNLRVLRGVIGLASTM